MGIKASFSEQINGNDESVDRTQRSSQGTFLIRGDQGGIVRLERAEVNGDTVVYTADCHDRFIRTKTKQASPVLARHVELLLPRWTPCGMFEFLF